MVGKQFLALWAQFSRLLSGVNLLGDFSPTYQLTKVIKKLINHRYSSVKNHLIDADYIFLSYLEWFVVYIV